MSWPLDERVKWVRDYIIAYHHVTEHQANKLLDEEHRRRIDLEPRTVNGSFVRSYAVITQDLLRDTTHTCNESCDTIE